MTEEIFVIQTKTGYPKFPIDKRNRFIKEGEILTTMDFLETFHFVDYDLALSDIKDYNLQNDFEVVKYTVTYSRA